MSYHHTAILTANLATSQSFYEALGLVVLRRWEKPAQRLSVVALRHPDGFILELIHHPDHQYLSLPLLPELFHIGFAVADIQLVLNRLPDIQLIKPITPGVSVKEFAFIRDPSGLPVELVVEKEGQ